MAKKNRRDRKKRSTSEAAKRRAEQHKAGFEITSLSLPEGTSLFRLKSDKTVRVDIIPYEVGEGNPWADKGELHYERTYWVHRGIGTEESSYICLRKTLGEKCPICEHRVKLGKDPDADEDLIKDLAPKERQLFNVVDVNDRDKGVQLWELSFHLFGKRLDKEINNADADDNYADFAELEGGLTLKLGVEEKSFGRRRTFFDVETINFKPRREDYDEDILKDTLCLDDILKPLPYEELKAIFLQTEGDDGAEDVKSSKKKSSKEQQEDELGDLTDENSAADFDAFEDEITKRCKKAGLDDEDYTTRKEAEMAVREKEDEHDDSASGDGDELSDLTSKSKEKEFDAFEEEITKRCKKVGLDDKDYVTWKEAEMAVREKKDEKASDATDEIEVGSEVTFEDDSDEMVTGTVKSIKGNKALVQTDDGKVTVKLSDLTLATEGSDTSGFDTFDEDFDELSDLTEDSDEEKFKAFEDEITKRCKEVDLDPDDFDTWCEAEMAVRAAERKAKSTKSSKKSKKKSKKKAAKK